MRGRWAYLALVAEAVTLGLPGNTEAQGSLGNEAPIRLQAATFLPSRGEPTLPPHLRITGFAPGVRGTYIVQFEGPIQDAWKATITAAGGELLEYIPDFAFKVRMTPSQARAVRQQAAVRWVGLFHPAYKLSPRLTRSGERLYTLMIDPGADGAAAQAVVRQAGARVLSREGRTLRVWASAQVLDILAGILDVAWIENFTLRKKLNEKGGGVIMGSTITTANGYDGSTQTVGVADTGIGGGTKATAHTDIAADRVGQIYNWPGASDACFQSSPETDIGSTPENEATMDVDTGHGTHVTVSVLGGGDPGGKGKGTAPGAHLVFQAVENYATVSQICQILYGLTDGYYLLGLPTDLRNLFQQAYAAGARIHSDSWGADVSGQYTADSVNTDDFVWSHRDMTITLAAGNAGVDADSSGGVDGDSMGAPATAKNVISVGASENDRASDYPCDTTKFAVCGTQGGQNTIFTYGSAWPFDFPADPLKSDASAGNAEQMAAFSSRGPTDDGRIKPDVVAPGTWVLSGFSAMYEEAYGDPANPTNGQYQYDGWGYPLNASYKYMGGTSMSTPLVAGGAAVVRDFYEELHGHAASAALVKATLINSAVDLLDENNDGFNDNAWPIPNFYEGWGRVNLVAATDTARLFQDEAAGLSTGGSQSFSWYAAAGTPFKVTLVWTDYRSTAGAGKKLVNDLDLEVSGPGGLYYRGNVFGAGWSIAGGLRDNTNNVENVFVQTPVAGTWTVTVRGYSVPQGPQKFALAVAGQSVQALHPLTVTKGGLGAGVVTSVPSGINCGGTCTALYVDGTLVTLDATHAPGSAFSGWMGACTGSAACYVRMDQGKSVTATFTVSPVGTVEPVSWTKAVGVTASGNNLTKSTFTSWGNAGASSTRGIESGYGYAEFAVPVSPGYAMFGLSSDDADQGYADIDYAFYPYPDTSTLYIYEKGVYRKIVGSYTAADTLRITVDSGAVTYWRNGVLLYTSSQTAGYPLRVDTALYSTGAAIQGATIAGTLVDVTPVVATVEPVSWTKAGGVTASGNNLTKTAYTSWGNAGASSTRGIQGGYGYAEFTVSASPGYAMSGLSSDDADQSYRDIDYAFYPYPDTSTLYIYEKGVYRKIVGSYAAADTLRISVDSGTVTYWKNGVLLYTSSQLAGYPLRVDTALYSTGAAIQGATIAGTLVDVTPVVGAVEPVSWTKVGGVSASGNNLTKTAYTSWGNAGASSTRGIQSGYGYAEFTVPASPGYAMFGLSSDDADLGYGDIDYAFYPYPDTPTLYIYEKGVYRKIAGSYAASDTLRITVDSGTVTYWKNGVLLYTSSQLAGYPLRVDTALYSKGAAIQGATIAGTLVDVP